jgi:hypothetical protein
MAKYRVNLDLSFDLESDAKLLTDYAKTLLSKAKNINEGKTNEETSVIKVHTCRHDEGLPCSEQVITEAPRVKPKI